MDKIYKGPDPVTTEIIRNGFIAATEEMKTNLMRTAYNMIIYEALDFTVGLFDRHGNTVSIGLGLPMFIRGMSETIKAKLAHFGADGLQPGDVLLTNDAYTTGSHLNHMTFSVPIFHDGRLIGFSACMAHWQDIGGTLDGMTTDIYSEGLQMPIVKAWRAGVPNEEILSIIRMNVRLPERAMGDLKAQVAAVRTGEKRFLELIAKYGEAAVDGAIESIFDHGEAVARASVAQIPDGVYEAESFMDDDGIEAGRRIPIRVKVTVTGDELTIDLTDVGAQVRGFYNSGETAGRSAAQVAFKCLTSGLELPVNDGAFRNLSIVLPPGRVVSAERPAPMRWWMTYPMTVVDTIFKALAPAIPTRVIAGHHADLVIASINGRQPLDQKLYLYLGGLIGGGWGAKMGEDGMSATVAINDGDTHNGPSEQVEAKYPLIVERYALREDSGGAGKYRGGLGTEQVVRARHDIMFNAQIDRVDCRPWGLFGGLSALGNEVRLERDGTEERFPTGKVLSQKLSAGDVYTVCSGGGGGFGSPLERNLADLENDLRQGYVSRKAASEFYGAAFDKDGRIDRDATALRRIDMRRRGLPKDRPFATEDHSDWGGCPYCDRMLWPHPEAEQMAREAAANGLSRWRCC
ncbi:MULTISPECIES: hydantoinase B/oxoprolinase family protein [unclassified Chelatococcus]|uniref:hydantoinase B/oxoprolinase family protein n=1 Tax=unclassified Chelatococcus TaxID=2638111 RepID=UPI001BCC72DD|nr:MULTISPECIES: hydantoinase B/oxoprolinase family protein [unclassified Chelatococcus]MBS7699729.1 hydantoinase B/oxoprolinase family protein [Chelatococcus sp. YT9]MBX3557073.1 hydantoinase B/oxoprolinase family protein [Chelatococcus sp.]